MQTIMIVEDDPDIRDGVRIALDCNRVWVDEQEADLTETEYKILKLLMQSPQRIFPVQVIYETVWGEPYFYVSNGTVMVHIRNLRQQQLDKEHRSEAAALCSGVLFFAPYYTFSSQTKAARPAKGSPLGRAGAKRLRGFHKKFKPLTSFLINFSGISQDLECILLPVRRGEVLPAKSLRRGKSPCYQKRNRRTRSIRNISSALTRPLPSRLRRA